MSHKRELVGTYNRAPTIFAFDNASFYITLSSVDNKQPPIYECPVYNLLWAEYSQGSLAIDFLVRKTKASKLSLVHIIAQVNDEPAGDWVDALMQAAYSDIKLRRKFKVIINPKSGKGKGPSLYSQIVEPIFKSARCTMDVIHTSHAKHAQEIAKKLVLDYDAVVVISGDGLPHEIFNGFAEHSDPKRAFSIPLALVSGGSANGTCLSILGLKDGKDLALTVLNAVKGRPMRIDLCSVTQKNRRIFSFMSQATGLIADLDLGTQHIRWMGSSRFLYGFIRGSLFPKTCPITVSVKAVSIDKHKMYKDYKFYRSSGSTGTPSLDAKYGQTVEGSSLPPLKFGKEDKDGWIDLEGPFIYLYAGKVPFASAELMQWPLARPDDGLIDLVLQEKVSAARLLGGIIGAERASSFWDSSQLYMKAEAYRVKTRGFQGNLSIDGEEFPYEEFQVEVHRGMATILCPYGRFAPEFDSPVALPVA